MLKGSEAVGLGTRSKLSTAAPVQGSGKVMGLSLPHRDLSSMELAASAHED